MRVCGYPAFSSLDLRRRDPILNALTFVALRAAVAARAGAELDGTLVYPETRQQQLGCVPGGPRLPPDTILMLDTSGCGNTMKALNAQARGAVGVLLVENDGLCTDPELPCAGACGSGPTCTPPSGCLCELPELNDDGEGSSINIPVMLVSLHDGGPIKRCMMGFGGAGCPSGTTVTASFQWYEPNPSPLGTTLSVSGPGISGFFDHKVSNWGSPKISGVSAVSLADARDTSFYPH